MILIIKVYFYPDTLLFLQSRPYQRQNMTERSNTNDEVTALKEEVTLMREAIRKLTEREAEGNRVAAPHAANAAKERNRRITESVPIFKGEKTAKAVNEFINRIPMGMKALAIEPDNKEEGLEYLRQQMDLDTARIWFDDRKHQEM